MSVQSVCLGCTGSPYAYSRTADDTDGAPVKPLPSELVALARRAVDDTGLSRARRPAASTGCRDRQLLHPRRRLGSASDGEEPSDAPVVTSASATLHLPHGGPGPADGPFTDVRLESGDLLVFGGRNRRVYHGVPKVFDGAAPPGSGCLRAASVSRSGRPA